MNHNTIETKLWLMIILVVIVVSFGGLAEIVPLFSEQSLHQNTLGIQPLTALQLEGRDIYIREGCNVCHTQMIRPLLAETERYGHYSVADESLYEHPFLWGSKRTGPDLARIGGKYGDDWHRVHLNKPQDVVPESVMPAYSWLATHLLTGDNTEKKMRALQHLGVPYTDADFQSALQAVNGKTELDAVVAYLQQLGTALKTMSAS